MRPSLLVTSFVKLTNNSKKEIMRNRFEILVFCLLFLIPKLLFAQEKDKSKDDFLEITRLNHERNKIIDSIILVEKATVEFELEKKDIEDRSEYDRNENFFSKGLTILGKARDDKNKLSTSDIAWLRENYFEFGTIADIEGEIVSLEEGLEFSKKRQRRLDSLNQKITGNKILAVQYRTSLESIGREIDKLVLKLDQKNNFRIYNSITFAILVGLVIFGFFFVVFKKENIVSDIFSGEKGIQFITLFLIIIAVILFGVMGILESRELSALLGALSGYILGRTSHSSTGPKPKPD